MLLNVYLRLLPAHTYQNSQLGLLCLKSSGQGSISHKYLQHNFLRKLFDLDKSWSYIVCHGRKHKCKEFLLTDLFLRSAA